MTNIFHRIVIIFKRIKPLAWLKTNFTLKLYEITDVTFTLLALNAILREFFRSATLIIILGFQSLTADTNFIIIATKSNQIRLLLFLIVAISLLLSTKYLTKSINVLEFT